MTTAATDEALAARARAGDGAAFACLVSRHAASLLAFCERLLGRGDDAEDRAQEAFLRAFRGLRLYDPARPFLPWLLRIAHNACVDALRARRPVVPLAEETAAAASAPPLAELRDGLDAAVAALPEKQRAVLHAKYTLGLAGPEIASALGLTQVDVRVTLHRAIRSLRERLKP